MYELGSRLGDTLASKIKATASSKEVCIACTVEDADFLAKGLLDELDQRLQVKVKFACFWNKSTIEPFGMEQFEIAPIIKTYKEPVSDSHCVLVIVKSIISGACVVATNIAT